MDLLAKVNPHFGDFVLLAILLLLMHMLTTFELWRKKIDKDYEPDQKGAAVWSFGGIFFTLVAGILSEGRASSSSPVDTAFLSVPLLFMGRWAFHYWKLRKELLDLTILDQQLTSIYRNAIGKTLDEIDKGEKVTPEEIALRAQRHIQEAGLLPQNTGSFSKYVNVSVAAAINKLLPSLERLAPIIEEEMTRKTFTRDGASYTRPGS